MWFKVATEGASVTSSCPLRPSQAGFLIRALGRGHAWLLLQGQGKPYLLSPGPLTLDPLSLSSTNLMGRNTSFRQKRYFLNLRVHLFFVFFLDKAHFKQPLTLFIHSFTHSFIQCLLTILNRPDICQTLWFLKPQHHLIQLIRKAKQHFKMRDYC